MLPVDGTNAGFTIRADDLLALTFRAARIAFRGILFFSWLEMFREFCHFLLPVFGWPNR
jgi:hypothetical protein